MPKIKLTGGYASSEVVVEHKDLDFTYFIVDKRDIWIGKRRVRKGTKELSFHSRNGNCNVSLTLNGRQIETVKRILKAA